MSPITYPHPIHVLLTGFSVLGLTVVCGFTLMFFFFSSMVLLQLINSNITSFLLLLTPLFTITHVTTTTFHYHTPSAAFNLRNNTFPLSHNSITNDLKEDENFTPPNEQSRSLGSRFAIDFKTNQCRHYKTSSNGTLYAFHEAP